MIGVAKAGRAWGLAIGGLLFVAPAQAVPLTDAQIDAANDADAQCLAFNIGVALAASEDEELDEAGIVAASAIEYYFGRLSGRSPHVDLAPVLDRAFGAVESDFDAVVVRCTDDYGQSTAAFNAMVERLVSE